MVGEKVFADQRGRERHEHHGQQQEPIRKNERRRRLVHQPEHGMVIDPRDEDDEGILMSMMSSVSAMANTPSQNVSSRVLGCVSVISFAPVSMTALPIPGGTTVPIRPRARETP